MLGDRIKELRKNKSMTLKELGEIANLSPSFISDIENNRTQPSLSRLVQLANSLGTTVCELLNEKCNFHEQPSNYKPDPDIHEMVKSEDLINELKEIKNWNQDDIDELISYLRAKNIIINSEKESD